MKPTKLNCQIGSTAAVKENMKIIAPGMGSVALEFVTLTPQSGMSLTIPAIRLNAGATVSILRAPKSYQGINCIFVKHIESDTDGYIYWSEFVNSFDMLELVAGNDIPKTKEEKLISKQAKMGLPGYYVEYVIDDRGVVSVIRQNRDTNSVICIGRDATAKYSRYENSTMWASLNWNIAPSRKFMTGKQVNPHAAEGCFESRYEYYPTWQDFVANCQLHVSHLSKQEKSPNDDFSP